MKGKGSYTAIAILLGGLGYRPYRVNQARLVTARSSAAMSVMSDLHQACMDYYYEYSQFPLGDHAQRDTVRLTTGKGPDTMMAALCRGTDDESAKEEKFFIYRDAEGGKNGLVGDKESGSYELFDPWGNPYHVLLDYDYDGKLNHPQTREILDDVRILIWSPGPDGQTGTLEADQDNVYLSYSEEPPST